MINYFNQILWSFLDVPKRVLAFLVSARKACVFGVVSELEMSLDHSSALDSKVQWTHGFWGQAILTFHWRASNSYGGFPDHMLHGNKQKLLASSSKEDFSLLQWLRNAPDDFSHEHSLGLTMSQNSCYMDVRYNLSALFTFQMSTFRQDSVARVGPL